MDRPRGLGYLELIFSGLTDTQMACHKAIQIPGHAVVQGDQGGQY